LLVNELPLPSHRKFPEKIFYMPEQDVVSDLFNNSSEFASQAKSSLADATTSVKSKAADLDHKAASSSCRAYSGAVAVIAPSSPGKTIETLAHMKRGAVCPGIYQSYRVSRRSSPGFRRILP